jgi:GNAT superfamily N-acetyltransferase
VTSIRPPRGDEGAALAALAARCAEELRSKRGGKELAQRWLDGADDDQALARLEADLATRDPATVVASSERVLTGFSVSWHQGGSGWVMVYVEPASRRQGYGASLLEASLHRLRSQGVQAVDALSSPGDRALKSLLERQGFKARLLTMRSSL